MEIAIQGKKKKEKNIWRKKKAHLTAQHYTRIPFGYDRSEQERERGRGSPTGPRHGTGPLCRTAVSFRALMLRHPGLPASSSSSSSSIRLHSCVPQWGPSVNPSAPEALVPEPGSQSVRALTHAATFSSTSLPPAHSHYNSQQTLHTHTQIWLTGWSAIAPYFKRWRCLLKIGNRGRNLRRCCTIVAARRVKNTPPMAFVPKG